MKTIILMGLLLVGCVNPNETRNWTDLTPEDFIFYDCHGKWCSIDSPDYINPYCKNASYCWNYLQDKGYTPEQITCEEPLQDMIYCYTGKHACQTTSICDAENFKENEAITWYQIDWQVDWEGGGLPEYVIKQDKRIQEIRDMQNENNI